MRVYLLLAAGVLLAGCGPVANRAGSGGGASTVSSDEASSEQKGKQIRLTLHNVMDSNGTGKLAGTYLLPEGYSAEDTIQWIPNDYMTPVVGYTTITSDDGGVVMQSMSGLETNFGHAPAGSFGADPPENVCSYLLNAWKKAHAGVSCTVVSQSESGVPEATQNGAGYKMFAKRGVIKLKYSKDGVAYLAKCNARIDVMMTTPIATAIGGTMYEGGWVISNNYCVSAPTDSLPAAMKLFAIVLTSYHTDPHFFNTVVQARDIISQNFYQRQNQIMETSRIISQTNDEISASINSAYKTSQAAEDREAANFDDYIRGVDRYKEPDGAVGLPSGYSHAWSDGDGKYIVTDEHLYNPNVSGPGGTWQELEKTQ